MKQICSSNPTHPTRPAASGRRRATRRRRVLGALCAAASCIAGLGGVAVAYDDGGGNGDLNLRLERVAAELSTSLASGYGREALARHAEVAPKVGAVTLEDLVVATAGRSAAGEGGGLFALRARQQEAEAALRRSGAAIPRIDVLLPADELRPALRSAEVVYVAVAPPIDEREVRSITAFAAGRRIELDPETPPTVPTLVVGVAERESLEPALPVAVFEEAADETDREPIDDWVGLPWIRISDDHEPWYKGKPEIVVRYRRFLTNGVFQDLRRALPGVNKTNHWYFLGDRNHTYLFFDDRWASSYELIVWEEDSPDSDDVVGIFIPNWRALPFGGYTERANRDARIRLDRD